ncbi:glycosyltransferase family 2 protein [Acetobacter sp.]|jgi:succinoglycan biosynthesis protein ExoO|uniref:glycosyltransferase family 2 protein n=1 Tax=Acetobacter sp. TaxID=440 RepID=UPI0025C34D99|nr:glycosyltransferase family 2 protein [Acetobacter sp.]MCH4089798.1 glycosyltransferase family 2 protein [Acetobacter sp.]MCI1298494.1 glycosyltransferase family 2 protein [Acetobacter sp.]MCI1315059.1 glycosyltransferase family 2 protein [Acetobacter sp.]
MTITFSVVIPAYNAEAFLDRAIHSVQVQTIPPKEILIIDDCSTDSTRDKVADMTKEDPRIRLLKTFRNGGPSAARNLGFENATGDWIAVLDADDAFAPNRLEQFSVMIDHVSADILADDLLYYDAGAACVTEAAKATRDFNGQRITLRDFLSHNIVDGKSVDWGLLKPVFRNEFLSETKLRYQTDMRHGEDFYFSVSALLKGARFILIDQPLYLYTQRSGSISKEISELTRTRIAYDALASSALSLTNQAGISGHSELINLLEKRAKGLTRLDDAHFFSVAIRKQDIKGLICRSVKRPAFVKHALNSVRLALQKRFIRILRRVVS